MACERPRLRLYQATEAQERAYLVWKQMEV